MFTTTIGTLRSLRKLHSFWLRDPADDVGKPKDWLVEWSRWAVQYVKIRAGFWPRARSVLLAPTDLGMIDDLVSVMYPRTEFRALQRSLPPVEERAPLFLHRNAAIQLDRSGASQSAGSAIAREVLPRELFPTSKLPGFCSFQTLLTYRFRTLDAQTGYVSDVIAEDHNWAILFFVVCLSGTWTAKRFLVLPEWIGETNYREARLELNVAAGLLTDAPAFRASVLSERRYCRELLDLYYLRNH